MIRNILITGLVSVAMGIFAVAYTSMTPPQQIAVIKQWIELDAPYEGEPLAYETGPPAITTQPSMNAAGAAAFQPRKCATARRPHAAPRGFNGAAAFQPRKSWARR